MLKIDDSFCGYINIDDDKFGFTISQALVTLLPAESDYQRISEIFSRVHTRNIDNSEFLFGYDENSVIAIERNTEFYINDFQICPIIRFRTPMIIKAAGNTDYFRNQLTEDWCLFHAITFCGGNINAIFHPTIAFKNDSSKKPIEDNSTKNIETLLSDSYTHSTDIEIDGKKVKFTVSFLQSTGNNKEHGNTYNVKEFNAYISLSFEDPQPFYKIKQYYQIVHSLVAILTVQNNIAFDVYLSQRRQDGLFFKTGICKIFDSFPNYSIRSHYKVIPLLNVFDHINDLIKMISSGQATMLLSLLPNNNLDVHKIFISNIQDICTALEVAYNWKKRIREEDKLINELKKKIKKVINDFNCLHPEISVYQKTTISNSFQYLTKTLTQKIFTLYVENHKVIDKFISIKSLPEITIDVVNDFVKLRNARTHCGVINWEENVNLYMVLFALLYACFFKQIGMAEEDILPILFCLF